MNTTITNLTALQVRTLETAKQTGLVVEVDGSTATFPRTVKEAIVEVRRAKYELTYAGAPTSATRTLTVVLNKLHTQA